MNETGPVRRHVMSNAPPATAALPRLYEGMVRIRRAEESLTTLFAEGAIPGFIHLSIGQEAVSTGVMASLSPTDTIASTHRGHGHALAKGMDLTAFFLELMGKDEGLCRGRGGSMHVAESGIGMLGANGIVGAGIPIAMGSALAHQLRGNGAVAVAFFGDGATAEGTVHESFNMAALWKLPLLFACETNGWSEFSPSASQLAVTLEPLAAAYGMPYTRVDGDDVEAVAETAARVVDGIRAGGGPHVLDCHTTRVRGHFEGDAQKYRPAEQLAEWDRRDPIVRAALVMRERGMTDDDIAAIDTRVEAEVAAAVEAGRAGREPDFAAAQGDVYTASAAA